MTLFKGDDQDLKRLVRKAISVAHELGSPRVGSEHLFIALASGGGQVAKAVEHCGTGVGELTRSAASAAPLGAGAAADREALLSIGVDLDELLRGSGPGSLDRAPIRAPWFPLGSAKARARCAALIPPVGIDAQAIYETSLRIALCRGENSHRPHHLAFALVAMDPGVDWLLDEVGADKVRLLADLRERFPVPPRNRFTRTWRRLRNKSRSSDVVRRYQATTGRVPVGTRSLLTDIIT
jgi:hypothetical protein